MAYVRKTRDEWEIQQQTTEGWELATTEVTRRDAKRCVREYRENQPELAARIVKRRVRINQPATAGA